MPLGPKLVLAIQMIGLAFTVFWAFTLFRVSDTISIVIQTTILIGLYTRQTIAWMTARWLIAIGATITSILFLWVVMAGTTKFWILIIVAFEITLAWVFFYLLGRPDSRAYFHAPPRPNQAMQRTPTSPSTDTIHD
jgi:hypothetical protein